MSNFKIPKIDENDTSSDEEVEAGKVVVNNEPEKKLKNPYKSCNQYTYRNNNHNLWTPFLDNILKQGISVHGEEWSAVATFIRTQIAPTSSATVSTDATVPEVATNASSAKDKEQSTAETDRSQSPVSALAGLAAIACEEEREETSAADDLAGSSPPNSQRPLVQPLPLSLLATCGTLAAETPSASTPAEAQSSTAAQTGDATTSSAAPVVLPTTGGGNDSSNTSSVQSTTVQFIPSSMDCSYRWINVLKPRPVDQFPPWLPEEIAKLERIVGQQQRRIEESGRGGKLHWPFIAAQMGRSQPDVVRQHALQYNASLRHGTFTPEEDAHILKRYREWHSTYPGQPGLWVALEKEMSRKDKRISERWRHVLAKRHAVDSQTVEFTPGDGNITIGDLLYGNVNLDDVGTAGASASAGIAIMCGEDREGDGREKGNNMGEYQQQQSAAAEAAAESWVVGVGKKRGLHQAFSPEPLITGLIRWDDALDDKLREAVSLYPRDWVRISQHVGVEAHGSKCRKRWARIQEKHRKSLLLATSVNSANGSSNTIAVHDAADGVSDGGGGVGLDIYDRVDSGHSFSFGDPRDGGDGYEDLGDMDGGLDLEEEGHH